MPRSGPVLPNPSSQTANTKAIVLFVTHDPSYRHHHHHQATRPSNLTPPSFPSSTVSHYSLAAVIFVSLVRHHRALLRNNKSRRRLRHTMTEDGGSRKRKRRRNRQKLSLSEKSSKDDAGKDNGVEPPKAAVSARSLNSSKPSSFLDKMRARLSGGHFRMINEKLYTCSGDEALNYFKEYPSLFNMYHVGYQEQMSHWPELPVNIITKWLKDHSPSLVVADFGCGDARLSRNVKNKVFSIDLVSNDPSVIACDMANTPLDSSSVDVAIFCLSLMGTTFPNYLQEAHRVLKPRGWLLIAEVKSRFDPNTGGADPDSFSKAICELGFTSVSKDFSNKMFILLYFRKKKENSRKEIEWPSLKPCLYKRR